MERGLLQVDVKVWLILTLEAGTRVTQDKTNNQTCAVSRTFIKTVAVNRIANEKRDSAHSFLTKCGKQMEG